MADTFKGIITADGKKRQLPYGSVLEIPVADKTLEIEGAFADSKEVGERFAKVNETTASLKEDLVDLDNWLGYPVSLINCNDFTSDTPNNFTISTTRNSISVVHENAWTTGNPILNLNLPVGDYKINVNYNGHAECLVLFVDNSYKKTLFNGDLFSIENGKSYSIIVYSDTAETITITDLSVFKTKYDGKINDIDSKITTIQFNGNQVSKRVSILENSITFVEESEKIDIKTIENKAINKDGSIITAGSTSYCISDYVDVSNDEKVSIVASANWGNCYYGFFREDKTFIDGMPSDNVSTATTISETVNVPDGAKYIVIGWVLPNEKGSVTRFVKSVAANNSLKRECLSGKTWCVIGDSLTDKNNNQAPTRYFDYLSYDSTIVNCGESGTGYLQTYNGAENYVDRVNNFVGNEGYDVISVMGGINDSGHIGSDYQLGVLGDTEPTTIYGAIYHVFNTLITKYPLAFVFAITEPVTEYRHDLNNNIDRIQDAVRDVCNWLKIPIADVNANSGLRPWIPEFMDKYYHDNTHPNSEGHKLIAKSIKSVFDYMY